MERISRYPIVGEIARGGMGVVYRAHDAERGRDVAIKLLMAGRDATDRQRERFLREAQSLKKLSHPNIVPVFEYGEHERYPYMVMELVDGLNLRDHVKAGGPLASIDAAELTLKLADALVHIHEQSILHRDIKPENVLLRASGEPLLTDFGLVKDEDADAVALSKTGEHIGTPGYWSPEQAMGERERLGPHSDVYSLGATLYTALTATPPFDGGSIMELVIAACNVAPDPPSLRAPDVHPVLETICLKCMEKAPEDRYPTATALAQALEAFVDSQAVARRLSPRRSRFGPITICAVFGVLVVACTELFLGNTTEDLGAAEAELDLEDAGTWLQRGHYHRYRNDLRSALRAYDRALEHAPDDASIHNLRGRVLLRLGNLEEAVRALSQALALDPQLSEAYANRGLVHAERGDHQSARDDFAHALALDPNSVDGLVNRARSNIKLGLYSEAISDCTRAIELDPKSAQAFNNRGAARFRLGEAAKAASDFSRATELEPDWAMAHHNAGLANQQAGRFADALKHFTRVVALDPQHVAAHNGLGEVRSRSGDPQGAAEAFTRAMDLGRQDARIYYNRGLCRGRLEAHADALEDYDQALMLDAAFAPAHFQRGQALSALKRDADALEAFRQAATHDPKDPKAPFKVGLLLARQGETQGAIDHYTQALKIDPTFERALSNRAKLYLGKGDYLRALSDLDEAFALLPVDDPRRAKLEALVKEARARYREQQ